MNEFSQATLLYHVFQKCDSYLILCKFGAFYSQINISSTCICELYFNLFFPTSWVILKQLDPSPARATGLIVN